MHADLHAQRTTAPGWRLLGGGVIATGSVAQTIQAACDSLCESLADGRTSDHADVAGAYQSLRGALARALRAVS